MKKTILSVFIIALATGLLIFNQAACQSNAAFTLEGQVKGLNQGDIILNRLEGHKEFKIKETKTNIEGHFKISLDETPMNGQYRLRVDPGKSNGMLHFLVSGKDISFTTHLNHLIDSIVIKKSPQNKAFYAYFSVKENFENRLSILEQLLSFYPKDERFYPGIIKEYNLLQDELEIEVNQIVSAFPNTLLARYIRSDQPPRMNPNLTPEERQEFMQYNYLNNVDFTDTLLLYTDIFPSKVLNHIMLYRNPQNDREKQIKEFIRATDNLLPLAMIQPRVYNYLLAYTISGFEQIGMEEVLTHIAENYPVDESCVSDHDSGELQKRMEGYRMLASGRAAPEITTTDINGKSFTLSEVKAQNILVVFWASWCPHCTVLLPEIKSFAMELNKETSAGMPPKLKVVSVSIDHNEKDYQDYIQKQGFNDPSSESYWVNLCDFNAWDGVVASDYYLFATPTMLLLGNDRLITAKPSSIRDVANQLKK